MERLSVASTQAEKAVKIDAMMEQASKALVARDYFAAERLASGALRRAHQEQDHERMARILLPLQEARRLKRQLAIDANKVTIVDGEIPHGRELTAGCYLVMPPRVGVDGRMLREAADEKKTPVIVVVREPTSRDGLWPLVAVGPVTVRTKVTPPKPAPVKPVTAKKGKKPAKGKGEDGQAETPATPAAPAMPVPTVEWFLRVCEQLGDEAISQVPVTLPAAARVDALLDRLEAHPNHEKLHQRLQDACRDAELEPPRKRRTGIDEFLDEDF
jgi:hypothetical protein